MFVDNSIAPVVGCHSATTFPGNCGVGLAGASATKATSPATCSPFSWSGTLYGTAPLDPAPGGVTVTL